MVRSVAMSHRPMLLLVLLTLTAQLVVLKLSLDDGTFSIFCAGPSYAVSTAFSVLPLAFGILHLLLAVLLLLGLASLKVIRLRTAYVLTAVLCMCVLPAQSALVVEGRLSCDAP